MLWRFATRPSASRTLGIGVLAIKKMHLKHLTCLTCLIIRLYNLLHKMQTRNTHLKCFGHIFIVKAPIPKAGFGCQSRPPLAPETKVGYFLALLQAHETEVCRNVTKPDSPQVLHVLARAVWHHVLRLRQSKTYLRCGHFAFTSIT